MLDTSNGLISETVLGRTQRGHSWKIHDTKKIKVSENKNCMVGMFWDDYCLRWQMLVRVIPPFY